MSDVYKFRLDKRFVYDSGVKPAYHADQCLSFSVAGDPWLYIDKNGQITINKGYCWDGCSPKHKFFDLILFGTPDGIINVNTGKPKTYYASMVHDALYQFMDSPGFPYSRLDADTIFYQLLCKADFKPALIYYYAVRAFGRIGVRSRVALKKLLWGWS